MRFLCGFLRGLVGDKITKCFEQKKVKAQHSLIWILIINCYCQNIIKNAGNLVLRVLANILAIEQRGKQKIGSWH